MPVAWNKRIWLKILVHYMDAYVLYASILKKAHYFFNSFPRATYTYNYSSLKTKTSQKTLYPQLQIMCEIPAESFVCVCGDWS